MYSHLRLLLRKKADSDKTPFQTFDGKELCPTIQEKGARLSFGLIKNHCMACN
jgi:prophage maintenance system killer protein